MCLGLVPWGPGGSGQGPLPLGFPLRAAEGVLQVELVEAAGEEGGGRPSLLGEERGSSPRDLEGRAPLSL